MIELDGGLSEFRLVWEPADGPAIPAGTLTLDPVTSTLSGDTGGFLDMLMRITWRERWAEETRRYWSGPDKVQRQIARAFRVRPGALGLVPRSAFTGEYRRRQRARVKRRRR